MATIGITEFITFLTVLLGGGMAGAWLMQKARFPSVIGFIMIGMIVGPYGLGVVTDTEFIDIFAEVGIVILLFVVGLEFSLQKLRRVGMVGMTVGTVQLVIVFSLGYITAISFGWTHVEALYLGGILSITSTMVSLRLVRDLGLWKTKEMNTVVTILILEDLAAVMFLTVLGNVSKGEGMALSDMAVMVLETLVFFVLAIGIGIKVVPKILEKVSHERMPEAPFVTSLAMGFSLAVLAHFLGLSTAIGAFLMGVLVASSRHSEQILQKVIPIKDFFAVMFFVSVGMLINLVMVPEAIWIALPIIAIAITGKFVGNFLAGSLAGHNITSASTVGVLMVPIAEFSYIMARQGVESGAIRESIYPATLIVSLATMFAMPLLFRAVPTVRDTRTVIPISVLSNLSLAARFFRQIVIRSSAQKETAKSQGEKSSSFIKKHGMEFMVHIVIIVAILGAMDYLSPSIVQLLEDPEIPFFMEPNLFLGILTVLFLTYPVFSIVQRLERFVATASDFLTVNIGRGQRHTLDRPLRRILRNILSVGLILVMVAVFITFSPQVEFIPEMPVLVSAAGFAISIPIILDTVLVLKRITHSHLVRELVSDNNSDEDDDQTPKYDDKNLSDDTDDKR